MKKLAQIHLPVWYPDEGLWTCQCGWEDELDYCAKNHYYVYAEVTP